MIYNKVVKLCKEKGITISKLEAECNLANATVRRWDKQSPRVDNLERVAKYFGVPVDYFLKE